MSKSCHASIAEAFRKRRRRSTHNCACTGDEVLLHGNRIAWRDEDGAVWVSLCGWPTVTTMAYLNALVPYELGGFRKSRGVVYFGGRAIDVSEVDKAIALTGPLGSLVDAAERRLASLQDRPEAIKAGMTSLA